MKPMEFELPYWVSNGGDGSANVNFERTLEDADRLDSEQDEGWGEASASIIELKVEDGKLYYFDFADEDAPRQSWIEVPQNS